MKFQVQERQIINLIDVDKIIIDLAITLTAIRFTFMNHTAIVDKVNSLEQKQFILKEQVRSHGAQIQHLKAALANPISKPIENKGLSDHYKRTHFKKQEAVEQTKVQTTDPYSEIKQKLKPAYDKASAFIKNKIEEATNKTTDHTHEPQPTGPELITDNPKPSLKKSRDLHKIEQDLGKVWFVRLGIISLLTGLVFLSNHAYQNYITEWGAGLRLAGMYFLATFLLGLGTYFEKAKVALSNYGKVLAAGGLATFYYTSYAAHHVGRLQVIDSPLLGGILLTMSASACLIYALWKKSNITAIFSIALAFYSTSINPIGSFTLISGLLLTLTGLILLHKLRSSTIGFVSMLGAYLSFVYWQVFVNNGATSYEHTTWFIGAYWLLSAASTWIPRSSESTLFSKKQLLAFSSINNGFLVLLMSIQFTNMSWVDPLWPVSAIIGSSFLIIGLGLKYGVKLTSALASIPFSQSLASLYLMKGTALITLSLCLFFTGPSIATALSVQAILVLVAARRIERPDKERFTYASGIIFVLSFFIYFDQINNMGVTQHLILAFLYLGYALVWEFSSLASKPYKLIISIIPTAFSIFAIINTIQTADISTWIKIIVLLGSNLALTIYYYLPKDKKTILPSFCIGSHLFSIVAAGLFVTHIESFNILQNLIITVFTYVLAAVNITVHIRKGHPHWQYTAYLTASTALLINCLLSTDNYNITLLGISVIPIIYHFIYQKLIKDDLEFIAALGFVTYPLSWYFYSVSFYSDNTNPYVQLIVLTIPLVHLILMREKTLKSFGQPAFIFTISTAVMLAIWLVAYIPIWELSYAVTAAIYYLWDRKENRILTSIAVAFYTISLVFTSSNLNFQTNALSIYTVSLIPFVCYIARRSIMKSEGNDLTAQETNYYNSSLKVLAILSSLLLWALSSMHLTEIYDRAALSIIWALVGIIILGIGFASKDIVFRTMAFIILGCTVVHVYGHDVWKLGSLLRILSFITLGIVLLVIGYFYSKKADDDESSKK